MDKTLARRRLANLITNFQRCRHQPQCTFERVAGYCVLHAVAHDGGPLYGHRHCWCELQGQHVIYYVIAVRACRMVRIFFLPYLGNRSKSDPCSCEFFCLESHILSFPKVLQIPPESPCMCTCTNMQRFDHIHSRTYNIQLNTHLPLSSFVPWITFSLRRKLSETSGNERTILRYPSISSSMLRFSSSSFTTFSAMYILQYLTTLHKRKTTYMQKLSSNTDSVIIWWNYSVKMFQMQKSYSTLSEQIGFQLKAVMIWHYYLAYIYTTYHTHICISRANTNSFGLI